MMSHINTAFTALLVAACVATVAADLYYCHKFSGFLTRHIDEKLRFHHALAKHLIYATLIQSILYYLRVSHGISIPVTLIFLMLWLPIPPSIASKPIKDLGNR